MRLTPAELGIITPQGVWIDCGLCGPTLVRGYTASKAQGLAAVELHLHDEWYQAQQDGKIERWTPTHLASGAGVMSWFRSAQLCMVAVGMLAQVPVPHEDPETGEKTMGPPDWELSFAELRRIDELSVAVGAIMDAVGGVGAQAKNVDPIVY